MTQVSPIIHSTYRIRMLTPEQAAGFLQRFMSNRDATAWLANDRQYSPVIPFRIERDAIWYHEDALVRFVRQLDTHAAVRAQADRREHFERRETPAERREDLDRRAARRRARNDLDRRFGVRPDRRNDLDRRIRGWVDRRCVLERRTLIEVAELELEYV